ncbi:NACHT ankyrin domain-containing protein [Fusarium phyllophilum]|uniref:NACHT ankyrin domain-containing protein n=1 Tax=Fusarium phyllophilum TaxID=47803 RepID=A0A8H5MPD8_9HYPO|nr:NACHT ankyrin domain-containing protein [Fusarium phyllophilum]
MTTKRPDRVRSQQSIHDITATNGSYLFAGNVRNVSFSEPRQVAPSFEDIIKKCRDVLFISHPDADRASIADAKGLRAPGTCEWILETSHYQAWLGKKSPLFWISGGPGTGKTVISLFLLEQVEKMCQGTDDHLLFYFCRFQHEYYNKPENLLRSLAYELLSFSTDKSRTLEVFSYLDTKEKAENALSSLECLWKILEILLSQSDLSTVYCIVDGVDECQSSDVLICKFRDYCASAVGRKGPLRLALLGRDVDTLGMATHSRRPSFPSESTPEPTFAETSAMNVFNGIKLDPDHGENINSDIARFTRWSLGSLQGIHGFENIRSQIEQILLARAEGTFLWVSFVVHELSKKRTCLQVLETIQDIPPGLHPIFRRMLHQIDPKHHHISAEILRWIAIAMRPLTLRELAYAIGSGIDGMEDIIAICQPLLKQIDGRVLFVHQSTKEYLLRSQPDEDPIAELFRVEASKCHGEIAHRCLQILENSFLQHKIIRFSKSQLDNIKTGHEHHQLPAEVRSASELFNYAYLHWMKHARLSPKEAKHLFDFDRPFFREPSAIRQHWAVSLNLPLRRLQLASYLCIVPWLQALREERGKSFYGNRRWKNWVNSGYQGETPLDFAVKGNCEEAV